MNPEFDPKDLFDIPDPYASSAEPRPRVPDVESLPQAPTRSRTLALRVGAIGAAVAYEAALVGTAGLRNGATLTPAVIGYGVVLPLASVAVALTVVQRSSSRRDRVLATIAVGLLVFVLTTLLARAPGDESARGMLACIIGGAGMATGPILLAVFSMRHAFATGATWRTAALGLASGLVGAAATRLYCPNDAFLHVLVGHGLPILLAMTAAAALGTRFTRT